MSKKYFKYLMKSFWPIATVYITLFALFLAVIPFMIDVFFVMLLHSALGHLVYITVTGFACIFLSGLLPLLLHGRYYSKNRSDIILSMPMNRKQAFLTEGVFGLSLITTLLVGGYLLGALLCFMLGNGSPAFVSFDSSMLGFPILFLACIVTYLTSTFAVSVSNSIFQAIVMLLFVNLLPSLVNPLIWNPISYNMFNSYTINWLSTSDVYVRGIGAIITNYYDLSNAMAFVSRVFIALPCQLIFWGGLCVIAFFEFKKLKSEHLGTVIPQRFGVVNSLTVLFVLGFALLTEFSMDVFEETTNWYASIVFIFVFAYFLLSVLFFIFVFVLRRKAKFRKDDWVRYAIAIGGGLVLGILMLSIMRAINPSPVDYPSYYYID